MAAGRHGRPVAERADHTRPSTEVAIAAATAAPEEEENPLFQQVPHVYLRLSENDTRLTRALCAMYRGISREIIHCTETENPEGDRFLCFDQLFPGGIFDFVEEELGDIYTYKVTILSRNQRHMVLVIQPPRQWQQQEVLKLLLSLKNLYLMGFLHSNKWKLF